MTFYDMSDISLVSRHNKDKEVLSLGLIGGIRAEIWYITGIHLLQSLVEV